MNEKVEWLYNSNITDSNDYTTTTNKDNKIAALVIFRILLPVPLKFQWLYICPLVHVDMSQMCWYHHCTSIQVT